MVFYYFKMLGQTKSPGRGPNGRDNTEAIDMEMSDEDFDSLPEVNNKNDGIIFHFNFFFQIF